MDRRGFLTTFVGALLAPTLLRLATPRPKLLEFPLGLILRVYPNLLSSELIKVQPMDGPTDLVFHMNFVSTASLPSNRIKIPFRSAITTPRWKITC